METTKKQVEETYEYHGPIAECTKHKIKYPVVSHISSCDKCDIEKYKNGLSMCGICGDWFKRTKRIYVLCDPEEKAYRMKPLSEEEAKEICGYACSNKCVLEHEYDEWH